MQVPQPPGPGVDGGSSLFMQLLAGLQQQQQQQQEQQSQQQPQQQAQLAAPLPQPQGATFAALADMQEVQHQQQPPPGQQDTCAALLALLLGMQQPQAAAVQQQQQQPPAAPHPAQPQPAGDDGGFLVTLLQVLAAASGGGRAQQAQQQVPALLPLCTAAEFAPPVPSFSQLLHWACPGPHPSTSQAPPLPAVGGQQSHMSYWLSQFPGRDGNDPSMAPPSVDTAISNAAAAIHPLSCVDGGLGLGLALPRGPSKRRSHLPPPFPIPPEAKRRRSGADLIYGPMGSSAERQQALLPHGPAYGGHLTPLQHGQPPPQVEQQMAAAAATLAAVMAAGQSTSHPAAAASQQPHSTQMLLELLMAVTIAAAPAEPALNAGSGIDFQAALAATTAASLPSGQGSGPNYAYTHTHAHRHGHGHRGGSEGGHGSGGGGSRHGNAHGYGVAVPAPEGMQRSDMVALYATPREQVERSITNQTYILRLHVTTQMAQLLFPPRSELEAAHQAALALHPPPPPQSRLGGGSTYIQLFKQRLNVVDENDKAWPVQYEGFLSSGQRHYRLTSGWVGLMRAQQVAIGDTLVLERWTDDRWIIHLCIKRKAALEAHATQQAHDAADALAGAAAGGSGGGLDGMPSAMQMPLAAPLVHSQALAAGQPSQHTAAVAGAAQEGPPAADAPSLQPAPLLGWQPPVPGSLAEAAVPFQPAAVPPPGLEPDLVAHQLNIKSVPGADEAPAAGAAAVEPAPPTEVGDQPVPAEPAVAGGGEGIADEDAAATACKDATSSGTPGVP